VPAEPAPDPVASAALELVTLPPVAASTALLPGDLSQPSGSAAKASHWLHDTALELVSS
jgi:hypothetical protein